MAISPARKTAFQILLRIEREKAYSSVLLPSLTSPLSPLDQTLCHELVLGTLRRQLWLDRLIDLLTKAKKLDIEVRIALRLGIYQIRVLDRIPDFSAVNESVNLVGWAKKVSAKGLVNAVLRSVARELPTLQYIDEIDKVSIETSHPRWLVERWAESYSLAEAASIAAANNFQGDTAFRPLGTPSETACSLIERSRPSEYVRNCYLTNEKGSELIKLSENNEIYLQDEASQLVAHSVNLPVKGSFLDLCAAPGGKAGLIAALNSDHAALIAAADVRSKRVRYLAANCRAQGAEYVNVIQLDAEKGLPFADRSFDTILVDAPCSGTGTIRHNPEIRYYLQPDDLLALHSKQLSILRNASRVLRVGGTMVYSTCSFETEENEAVCSEFLLGNEQLEAVTPSVPDNFITKDRFARTWPHKHGMDGFFIAKFSSR